MGKRILSWKEVLEIIKELAKSTGLYGRLYRDITESEESLEEFKEVCRTEKFTSDLDFILWYEC